MQVSKNKLLSCLAILTVAIFGILLFGHKKADVDLWGNLGFVSSMPWSDSFHKTNTFSYTEPDHEWTNHEWLAEYVLNTTYRHGGNRLLLALKITTGLLLAALLYSALSRTCRSPSFRFFFLLLVMSTIGYGFSTRPHLFTYLMLTFLLTALRFKPKCLLYAALPAGILWANLHGAFFTGIIVAVLYLAGILTERSDEPRIIHPAYVLLAAALFVLGSFVNPYGTDIWTFISGSAVKTRTYLSEWAPFHPVKDIADHTDFVALLAVCAISSFLSKGRERRWLVLGWAALLAALVMRRNIPLFAIVSVFAFAPQLDRQLGHHLETLTAKINFPIKAALLTVMILISAYTIYDRHRERPFQIEVDASRFPVGCVEYIKKNQLEGNILAFFDWAEYCIWELHPESRVFLDGRYMSAYSTDTIDIFFDFIYGSTNWENALTAFPTEMVLIHKGNPAYNNMLTLDDWTLVCHDSVSALFLKNFVFASGLYPVKAIPYKAETPEVVVFK